MDCNGQIDFKMDRVNENLNSLFFLQRFLNLFIKSVLYYRIVFFISK